jgi:hypothetical protein
MFHRKLISYTFLLYWTNSPLRAITFHLPFARRALQPVSMMLKDFYRE